MPMVCFAKFFKERVTVTAKQSVIFLTQYSKLHICCIAVFVCIFITQEGYGQKRRIANGFELYTGLGLSYFSGDLGGTDDFLSVNKQTLDLAVGAGLRYYFTNRWAVRAGLHYGRLSGDDSLSSNEYRKMRNLDFKSNVYDFSLQIEFSLFNWNFRDEWSRQKNYLRKRQNLYIFTGISVFHFRPYGQLNGQWYSLQELSTAGQGLQGGIPTYSLNSYSIPVGVGYKFLIKNGFSIGFEATFRKTFTDNIDDVSNPYYSNASLRQQKGDIAADIADKNRFPGGLKRPNGDPRGNPNSNDNFAFFLITLNKKLNARKGNDGCPTF